jgi:hypothetical protein
MSFALHQYVADMDADAPFHAALAVSGRVALVLAARA